MTSKTDICIYLEKENRMKKIFIFLVTLVIGSTCFLLWNKKTIELMDDEFLINANGALLFNSDKTICILINGLDHIKIQVIGYNDIKGMVDNNLPFWYSIRVNCI